VEGKSGPFNGIGPIFISPYYEGPSEKTGARFDQIKNRKNGEKLLLS
jgi:hypothetical protein